MFTTYIALGAAVEAITANGASLTANSSNSKSVQDRGKALLKAALILQLALMVGFIALAGRFHYNCARAKVLNKRVKRPLYVLYASSTLITIRTIYRTVEYFTAASLNITDTKNISPVLKDEWFFWIFETLVMFSNTTLLNAFYPMSYLPRSNKIYLAQDGVTEIEGPGFEDRRPFLLTLVDPFDLVGLITRRGKQNKYWESNGTASPDASKVNSSAIV